MLRTKKYKYLIAYIFTQSVEPSYGEYTASGTGRSIVTLDYKVKTTSDICRVESYLKANLEIDNLRSVSLISFNRIQ